MKYVVRCKYRNSYLCLDKHYSFPQEDYRKHKYNLSICRYIFVVLNKLNLQKDYIILSEYEI